MLELSELANIRLHDKRESNVGREVQHLSVEDQQQRLRLRLATIHTAQPPNRSEAE
jgi:hypothetical protein